MSMHVVYFALQHPHLEHALPTHEIHRLQISARCKRKAEEEDAPLRQLFDDVCRQVSPDEAQSVSITTMESAMYKWRRLSQPTLPRSAADADTTVRSSRYAKLNGADFYRGIADAAEGGTALLFTAKEQLDILKSATEVYFD